MDLMWACKCWDLKSSNYGNEPSIQAVGGMRSPLLSVFILIRKRDPGLMGGLELKLFHCAESVLHCLNESRNKGCCFWNNEGSLCLFQQVWLWERKGTLSLQPFTAGFKNRFQWIVQLSCNMLLSSRTPCKPPVARRPSLLLNEVVNGARLPKCPHSGKGRKEQE